MPDAETGLSLSDPTIAEVLKPAGYTTACIGKWHLGSQPQFMPNARGFDYFFGFPYSHDMLPLPLLRNKTIIQNSPSCERLTRTWTDEALRFINSVHKDPFFLYLAHTAPHLPLGVSEPFHRKTRMGRYADTVAELDWSVGQVLDTLAANNLEDDTLVMVTSDNGPWYMGSTGGLSGRKGQTYEGGLRVPMLARMPGVIPAGSRTKAVATGLDMMPTFARMAGVAPPHAARDGVDIMPLLTGSSDDVERPPFLYFDRNELQCIRSGDWKLHVARYNSLPWGPEPVGGRWNLRCSIPSCTTSARTPTRVPTAHPTTRMLSRTCGPRSRRPCPPSPPPKPRLAGYAEPKGVGHAIRRTPHPRDLTAVVPSAKVLGRQPDGRRRGA